MDMMHLLYKAFWLIFFLIQTHCADKYTDQNRPYEFGFKIDGQQDRHEKKDSNGIIMGQFGFITADDVYHVTVYATDAQGRFKILSMKNIHLKDTKSVTSVRQGHSLQIPSTHQVPAVQVTTTTTTQPIKQIAQEFQPVSLEPPVNSCSHCSLPTTSTAAPKPLLSISQPNANINYNIPETGNNAKVGQKTQSPIYPSGSNNYSPNTATLKNQQNSPSVASEEQGYPQKLESSQNYPTQEISNQNYPSVSQYQSYPTAEKNYPSESGTQQSYAPQSINKGQNAPETKQVPVNQIYTQETQKNSLPQGAQSYLNQQQNYATTSGTQQISSPQEINGEQNYLTASREQNYLQETPKNNLPEANLSYPQGVGNQQNNQPNSESNQYNRPQQGTDNFQPTKEQRNSINLSKFTPQTADRSNVGSTETNNQENGLPQNGVEQTPKEILSGGNVLGYRTPKQFNNENKPASVLSGQKPSLAYAQMQIVDKNTNIHAKAPGEKEGLPPGLSENDMVRLLYTFNYTLGFQGHFEKGYSNGVKQGYYFVTGRNGVRTRVDYVADDKGFRPKISQDVLDLLSDDVPKPETEKQAKYGLKGYEFKWLYFPQDSKKR